MGKFKFLAIFFLTIATSLTVIASEVNMSFAEAYNLSRENIDTILSEEIKISFYAIEKGQEKPDEDPLSFYRTGLLGSRSLEEFNLWEKFFT